MVAPEEDGTTEYVFEQSEDQVLSKTNDESGTGARAEED
jgi:hypothetical protein